MATEYLPNELLAYAFDSFDRDCSDDLEDVIENFYADGAVHDGKTLLWQKYKEQLPKWQDRRGNNAKRREVVDILSAIKTIDQQYSNGDVQPYVFVAVKLKISLMNAMQLKCQYAADFLCWKNRWLKF